MKKKNRIKNRKWEIGFLHNILRWWRRLDGKSRGMFAAAAGLITVIFLVMVWTLALRDRSVPALSEKVATVTASPAAAKDTKPPASTPLPQREIYSYLQGPKSWETGLKWSGEWGVAYFDGGSFGGFGCGLCCMANVYSSLTKYKCTPVDAYKYAKKHTGYAGGGAIDWGYMRRSLTGMGFDCRVYKKPKSYEKFQKRIKESQAAVVLVSSNDSDCYWKNTPGHYVTLFLYNEESDKVFLADSGDPKHNRHWVPLKKIYDSLKTASPWQYLSVSGYRESLDNWKHKKAKGNWVSK